MDENYSHCMQQDNRIWFLKVWWEKAIIDWLPHEIWLLCTWMHELLLLLQQIFPASNMQRLSLQVSQIWG